MLLDTAGLLCFHHVREPQHAEAVRLVSAARRLLTHNYVLAEFQALAHRRRIPRAATLALLSDLLDNQLVEVVFVDEALHRRGVMLLQNRPDKNWSLCDAVSFELMSDFGVTEALTTDHHFEQAGFVRLLRP